MTPLDHEGSQGCQFGKGDRLSFSVAPRRILDFSQQIKHDGLGRLEPSSLHRPRARNARHEHPQGRLDGAQLLRPHG